jgi:hypothetical protein
MPLPSPSPTVYLYDQSSNAWAIGVNNAQLITTTPITPTPASTATNLLLNDYISGVTYSLTVLPSPAYPSSVAGLLNVALVSPTAAPTQLVCAAPNGMLYAIFIVGGLLYTAVPSTFGGITIGTLVPQVQARLEETTGPTGDGQFWSTQFELRSGIIEACNDLMLLVGRPTNTVNVPFSLTPNTVWQQIPKGILLIANIRNWQGELQQASLHDMDYIQASWGPAWESDTSPQGPHRWGPLGFNMFFVHPATSVAQTVTLDAIAYPATTGFPYTGAETIPFHDECMAGLEQYASHYARLKESSQEFQQSLALYKDYLAMAKRLTQIESRRDDLIFTHAFGAEATLDPIVKR